MPGNGFIQIGAASRDTRPGALPSKPRRNFAALKVEELCRHARNIARGITALSRDDSVLWDPWLMPGCVICVSSAGRAGTVGEMDQGPINGEITVAGTGAAADSLTERVAELIDDSVGLSAPVRDWTEVVAVQLTEMVLSPQQAAMELAAGGGVEILNRALYRMSYEAALACEHARQVGSRGWVAAPAVQPSNESAGSGGGASAVEQGLRAGLDTSTSESGAAEPVTVGQLARLLCLCVIDTYEARDRYDYAAMDAALEACDHWLPVGCTLKSLRVLGCLRAVARAGLSRGGGVTAPSREDLQDLAKLVAEDRDGGGMPYANHALLLLVTAIGHMQRRHLVDDVSQHGGTEGTALVDWALGVLEDVEARGMANPRDWPVSGRPNPVAHHVYFYRYFARHIKAIAMADQLKAAAESGDVGSADNLDILPVRDQYRMASASLERALSLVPASNEARWSYYDLNAENLEHEESLRLELLEQRLHTRRTVESLARTNVEHFAQEAKDEVREGMISVSMRIVEIIGVFLAVVAILGATVASATVEGLSLTGRIVILAVGGTMPVIYFVLLRWIVNGRLIGRTARDRGTAR